MSRNELAFRSIVRMLGQLASTYKQIIWWKRLDFSVPLLNAVLVVLALHFWPVFSFAWMACALVSTTIAFGVIGLSHKGMDKLQQRSHSIVATCEHKIVSCTTVSRGGQLKHHILTECGEQISFDSPSLRKAQWLINGLATLLLVYKFTGHSYDLPDNLELDVEASVGEAKFLVCAKAIATIVPEHEVETLFRLFPNGIGRQELADELHESIRREVQTLAKKYPGDRLGDLETELENARVELKLFPYCVCFHTLNVKCATPRAA